MTRADMVVAALYFMPLALALLLGVQALFRGGREGLAHALAGFAVVVLGLAPFVARAFGAAPVIALDAVFDTHHRSSIVTTGTGPWIAACANLLALAALSFGRRYLHRDSGFLRFAALCLVFVLGFDLVAIGGSMDVVLVGWELVGLASTFLIGFYSDRSSARRNAVFAFACYRVADIGLAFCLVVLHHDTGSLAIDVSTRAPLAHAGVLATGLIIAAACKSSQFPLTSLLTRSMEGPTPTSALGYAGLSAHIGVVLLARTEALWLPSFAARVALVALGLVTAIHAQLVANTRADRKGVLGYATAGGVGTLFILLGLGLLDLALVAALGHAALRIMQVLRAPSAIEDAKRLRAALGRLAPEPESSAFVYRLGWVLRRFDHDLPELIAGGLSPIHRRRWSDAHRHSGLPKQQPSSPR